MVARSGLYGQRLTRGIWRNGSLSLWKCGLRRKQKVLLAATLPVRRNCIQSGEFTPFFSLNGPFGRTLNCPISLLLYVAVEREKTIFTAILFSAPLSLAGRKEIPFISLPPSRRRINGDVSSAALPGAEKRERKDDSLFSRSPRGSPPFSE